MKKIIISIIVVISIFSACSFSKLKKLNIFQNDSAENSTKTVENKKQEEVKSTESSQNLSEIESNNNTQQKQQEIKTKEEIKQVETKQQEVKQKEKTVENKKQEEVKSTESSQNLPKVENNPPKVEQQETKKEEPKVEKSDMEIAIEMQLSYGDPVTYNNGKPITISECNSIGTDLKNNRETTLVNRYECIYTSYGNATAVGLIVQFTIDGNVYRESYDKYKQMIN